MLLFNRSERYFLGVREHLTRTNVGNYIVGLGKFTKFPFLKKCGVGNWGIVSTNCWNRPQEELKSAVPCKEPLQCGRRKLLLACRISNVSSLCYQIHAIPVDFLLPGSRAKMILKCLFSFQKKKKSALQELILGLCAIWSPLGLQSWNLSGFIVKKWVYLIESPSRGALYLVLDQEHHWFHTTQNPSGRLKGAKPGVLREMGVTAQGKYCYG